MGNRLIHVPSCLLQCVEKKSVSKNKSMAVGIGGDRGLGDPGFLRVIGIVKDYGEGFHLSPEVRSCKDADQRRIDAARELASHLHVAEKLRLNALAKQILDSFFGRAVRDIQFFNTVRNLPVLADRDAAFRRAQTVPRAKLLHSLQQSVLAGHVLKRQVFVDMIELDLRSKCRMRKK